MLEMEIIEPEILELEPIGNIPRIESDYNNLYNKPIINGKELVGDLSLDDLDIQPKGDYALKDQIPSKVSQLENDKGFLTKIPNEYVTETELGNKGYITSIPSEYITSTELNSAISGKANTSDIPTKTSELTNDSGYLTEIPSEYITENELDGKGYATKEYVDNAIPGGTGDVDLSDYYTKEEIDAMLVDGDEVSY